MAVRTDLDLAQLTVDGVSVDLVNPSSGSINITANGTYDVTSKASAVVNVPTPSPSLQSISVTYTSNGSATLTPSAGFDGFDEVNITIAIPVYDGTVTTL